MIDLRKAAEMALEALRNAEVVYMEQLNAMYALQGALAQPEQEPVAWADKVGAVIPHSHKLFQPDLLKDYTRPLYTAPPRREWVGLTDEEAREIRLKVGSAADVYARAIEAALKEKNL